VQGPCRLHTVQCTAKPKKKGLASPDAGCSWFVALYTSAAHARSYLRSGVSARWACTGTGHAYVRQVCWQLAASRRAACL